MKCPECKARVHGDVRLLALHMDLAHRVPRSVILNVLRRMGYGGQIKKWRLDKLPTFFLPKQSTYRFGILLFQELKRKEHIEKETKT